MPRPRPVTITSRNSKTMNGKNVVVIYANRKPAATLHFPARNGETLRQIEELIGELWRETHHAEG